MDKKRIAIIRYWGETIYDTYDIKVYMSRSWRHFHEITWEEVVYYENEYYLISMKQVVYRRKPVGTKTIQYYEQLDYHALLVDNAIIGSVKHDYFKPIYEHRSNNSSK